MKTMINATSDVTNYSKIINKITLPRRHRRKLSIHKTFRRRPGRLRATLSNESIQVADWKKKAKESACAKKFKRFGFYCLSWQSWYQQHIWNQQRQYLKKKKWMIEIRNIQHEKFQVKYWKRMRPHDVLLLHGIVPLQLIIGMIQKYNFNRARNIKQTKYKGKTLSVGNLFEYMELSLVDLRKVFWKYAANLQENTHAEAQFQ